MLKADLRWFEIECFAESLFEKNRDTLRGAVTVSHVKYYRDKDMTFYGESKKGWRLVRLEGNIFLQSLAKWPESKRFNLGSSFIQIRGGPRKPEIRGQYGAAAARGAAPRGRGGFGGGRGRGHGRSYGLGAGTSSQ